MRYKTAQHLNRRVDTGSLDQRKNPSGVPAFTHSPDCRESFGDCGRKERLYLNIAAVLTQVKQSGRDGERITRSPCTISSTNSHFHQHHNVFLHHRYDIDRRMFQRRCRTVSSICLLHCQRRAKHGLCCAI